MGGVTDHTCYDNFLSGGTCCGAGQFSGTCQAPTTSPEGGCVAVGAGCMGGVTDHTCYDNFLSGGTCCGAGQFSGTCQTPAISPEGGCVLTGGGCASSVTNHTCYDNFASGATCCPGPVCADLQTDNSNCGSCGNVCPVGQTCQSGSCGPTALTHVAFTASSQGGHLLFGFVLSVIALASTARLVWRRRMRK